MHSSKSRRTTWRRDVVAWSCYDWANSGYTTLMITVFVVYIQRIVFDSELGSSTGAVVWAWSVAVSMLSGALLSPFAGAIADVRGGKRFGLAITALGGGVACIAMATIPSEWTWLVVASFIAANLCLELSLTFYNGFLPEIASESELNQVSSIGVSWGYLGGGLALLLAMLLINYGEQLGLGDAKSILRICIFGTGLWWMLFTIPAILILRDHPRQIIRQGLLETGKSAVSNVFATIRSLRYERTLLFFLIAFLIYNDGLQTVISQASTFALQELSFTSNELVAVVLMIQFIATPGAVLIGWIADRWGRQQSLILCLCVWIVLLTCAWFIETKMQYWFLAAGVALVLGGTQAVSRSIMGALTPAGQEARYFGFFNLSGKATSFLGTFFFGLIIATTGSSRLAIVNLLIFFVIGLLIIWRIDLRRPSEN